MINITHHHYSLHKAVAIATVRVSRPETITAIQEKQIPKGDVLEFSKAAGLLAIKKTSDVIPGCYPLPIEYAVIQQELEGLDIHIRAEVHTIYRTGVEAEAMHGAIIAALTLYDMLKPVDPHISISSIQPEKQASPQAGISSIAASLRCAVIVCSNSIAARTKQDTAGKAIVQLLTQYGVNTGYYAVVPDNVALIRQQAQQLSTEDYQLVLFTGGTGLNATDVTPEAIAPLLDRPIPGIMEAARSYGQERTPYALLSRGIAGFIQNMLVITLPGSTRGATESMQALFPHVLHLFR